MNVVYSRGRRIRRDLARYWTYRIVDALLDFGLAPGSLRAKSCGPRLVAGVFCRRPGEARSAGRGLRALKTVQGRVPGHKMLDSQITFQDQPK